jgi:hypothetical protein
VTRPVQQSLQVGGHAVERSGKGIVVAPPGGSAPDLQRP